MALFGPNTRAQELEILGLTDSELRALSNEQLLLLAHWRKMISDFGGDNPIADELYRRATGKAKPV
jgi:hypothetical protein